jgi:hypothetical protein
MWHFEKQLFFLQVSHRQNLYPTDTQEGVSLMAAILATALSA